MGWVVFWILLGGYYKRGKGKGGRGTEWYHLAKIGLWLLFTHTGHVLHTHA